MNVFDRIVLPLTGLIAIYIITSSRLQSCWSRVSLGPDRNRPRGGRASLSHALSPDLASGSKGKPKGGGLNPPIDVGFHLCHKQGSGYKCGKNGTIKNGSALKSNP